MSKKHQKNQINLFFGNHFSNCFRPKAVASDVSVESLISILHEAIDSPYADEDLLNHVDEFGTSLKGEDAKMARKALRAVLK